MPHPWCSKAALIGLALTIVAMGAIGFLPLFGGPGYESALAAGLVLPFVVAIVTALEVSAARPEPLDALYRGLVNGAALALAAYLTTLAHGLRTGFCDVLGGSAHFALGPGVGALMAGAWGAVAGEIAARRRTVRRRRAACVILGALGPLASFGVSVGRFYTSPMVFAYDPFAGFFSGSLYDTVVDVSGLVTYRVGSAATLLAALVLAAHLTRTASGGLAARPVRRIGLALVFPAALVASIASIASGPRLGHFHTSSTIARALAGSFQGARCDVLYPRGMELGDVQRFTRDCDAHVTLVEQWLGAPVPFRITAYLFADARQKGALMGAANTYIAKPWRREIYVQEAGYPHPALGHEIAHVLAGHFARGPFKVAGSAGGLVPDPGLIEGIAVAASPREGDLSPREWAKAMKDLGILPKLRSLFAFGFFGQNSSTAYTVSGAFVAYVKERFGAAAVRGWYGGRPLEAMTGVAWDVLERDWHADLDGIVLPAAALAQAKARFDRPAIFGRRCPHVVDACKERAEELRAQGDFEGAVEQYKAAMELDPGDAGLRVAIAKSALRSGRREDAARLLEEVAGDEAAPRHVRDRSLEELGDMALASGDGATAAARYREVMERLVDEDALRTLEVKIAAAADARARGAVVELLIGMDGRGPDKVRAVELLATWVAAVPDAGLPHYLLGRHYAQQGAGQLVLAAEKLDQALARRIGIDRVRVEARRLRLIVACGLGDAAGAAELLGAYVSEPSVSASRRDAARSLAARCGGPGPFPVGAAPINVAPSAEPASVDAAPSAEPASTGAGQAVTTPGAAGR